MASKVIIRPKEYHDSVRLMRVSEAIRHEAGVTEAMVMMATANNKKILDTSGLLTVEAQKANPDDLVIAIMAESESAAEAVARLAAEALTKRTQTGGFSTSPDTLDAAVGAETDINLACISVPGAFAYREASRALELGLNVFLFSDNVSLDDERKLKDLALEKNRLMMGPDCGTAIINGVGLGFANAVRRGTIGIVGASGTGIQQISSLLDRFGVGVSHAIGTGGRDLKEEIGGITMLQGLKLLADDPHTDVIVVTSKPPSPSVADKVLGLCRTIDKPIVVNFVGQERGENRGNITFASTLAEAAIVAAQQVDASARLTAVSKAERERFISSALAELKPGQRFLRALYAGGTLCYEALFIVGREIGSVRSNLLAGEAGLPDPFSSIGHAIIDLGDDEYTEGRAHPMIDPTVRNRRILKEAADPETALLLLDLILGYGAHENPAASLVETVARARDIARADGRALPVIVTICGTDGDIQGYRHQESQLASAGIQVAHNNAEAVILARELLRQVNAR